MNVTTTITAVNGVDHESQLRYSPRVGDRVLVCRDLLVEIARQSPGLPPTWRFLPAGACGKLLGWRERDGIERTIVDVEGPEAGPEDRWRAGPDRRLVVYLCEGNVTRAPVRRR